MPAQSTNIMGSIFGSNNAPPPIPGGYGNPTGANPGGMKGATNPLTSVVNPYMYTGPAYNAPVYNAGNMAGLNTGMYGTGVNDANTLKELDRAYGKGTGTLLSKILGNGLFNPSVAAAFLNALQPGIARGQNSILNSFGGAGARFSSAAGIGLGDYNSQVQLNEQQTLAGMYQHAQDSQLALLSELLPTLHKEQANHGGHILADILGGLEIAGGIAAAPFTGGMSLALVGSGVGTLVGANSGGGSVPSSPIPNFGGGTSMPGLIPAGTGGSANAMELPNISGLLSENSAASSLTDGSLGDTSGSSDALLNMLLMGNGGNA